MDMAKQYIESLKIDIRDFEIFLKEGKEVKNKDVEIFLNDLKAKLNEMEKEI